MKGVALELAGQYGKALYAYLMREEEAALNLAYQLGRKGLSDDLGIFEMAALHHEALVTILGGGEAPKEIDRLMRLAQNFFVESLSPFEMAHRQVREAVSAQQRVNEMLEEEIRKIAHALHDEAGQLLVSVHLALDDVGRDLPSPARQRMQSIRDLLNQIEEQFRRLSHELRPTILDDLGLAEALEFLAEGVAKRTGLGIRVEGGTEGRLPPAVELAIYRIAKEALFNVTKHAFAAKVSIRLHRDAQAVGCSVQDDGRGFVPSDVWGKQNHSGLGLIGIRERLAALGGTLQITSAPGEGTKLSVTIPLEPWHGDSSHPRR